MHIMPSVLIQSLLKMGTLFCQEVMGLLELAPWQYTNVKKVMNSMEISRVYVDWMEIGKWYHHLLAFLLAVGLLLWCMEPKLSFLTALLDGSHCAHITVFQAIIS